MERAGFDAIAVTVDTPVFGNRRADVYNNFEMPAHLEYANISSSYNKNYDESKQGNSFLQQYLSENHQLEMGWEDIELLRRLTKLKIIIKGLMCVEDAKICAEYADKGVIDGVWVSNHGGR